MKTKIVFSILFCVGLLFIISCNKKDQTHHFIQDKEYREQVHRDFLERREMARGREEALFSVMDASISTEEREALEFLYAYMPLSDLADYNGDFFLDQVKYSLLARDYFSWGKNIPEDIFRHFVLVYRVNNENLDSSRMVFFNELKDRVKDMSMYDAALEVNHWCHENVTYRPSDGRTSAPLATIKSGYGRCGEESTYTVTAMRAVGIPARQCYTPRWAHTDDNHAWVEVWVDGQWYFLGACEPDAELNMGWFAGPSTRTMMVHSNAFGKYKGKEEINYETGLFSRINMLPNYTDTKKITISVVDQENKPVKDAEVKFKLYNYAEFYPIATKITDNDGRASLTTGLGDLLIWAVKDGKYGYGIIRVKDQDQITVEIKDKMTPGAEYVEFFDITPPVPGVKKNNASREKIEINNKRLLYEDSLRNAYLATFMTKKQAKQITNGNLSPDQVWEIIRKSEGNYEEMEKLMSYYRTKNDSLLLYGFFSSLSDKDHRDATAEILNQHITYYNPGDYPKDVYLKGIISPRIANEGIRPWRNYLAGQLPALLENNLTPSDIMNWMERNITIDRDANYFNCPVSPVGVFELRYADPHSSDIFFVAACRSLNIPAYKDPATGELYAYEQGEWVKYPKNQENVRVPKGTLVLNYQGRQEIKPEYWTHFTIAKEENGDFVTFDYENDDRVARFPAKLELEPGYYILSTGNRYSDGPVLSRVEFFNIEAGKSVNKNIELRKLEPRDIQYGTVDMEYTLNTGHDQKNKVSKLLGTKEAIVCFIDPSREPTKHMLKDISAYKTLFEKWNGNMIFAIPSDKNSTGFDQNKWNLPGQSSFIIDHDSEWMNHILSSLDHEFRDNYPLIFIINEKGEVTFKSEGYRIGTGELLYKSLKTENNHSF